jgi:hypothetical protein
MTPLRPNICNSLVEALSAATVVHMTAVGRKRNGRFEIRTPKIGKLKHDEIRLSHALIVIASEAKQSIAPKRDWIVSSLRSSQRRGVIQLQIIPL